MFIVINFESDPSLDDVVHDVWLIPSEAPNPCNISGTKYENRSIRIIPPSHHATIDSTTEDTVVDGRNRYQIPESAAGKILVFVSFFLA